MELWLLRHGSTEWTRTQRHTGRTDVPLDEAGRREAVRAGQTLAGHPFAQVLVSPLHRARETCELAGFGAVSRVTPDLAEWDYGEYEGRTTDEIRAERPGWNLFADGVPAGESASEVGRRADRVVEAARAATGDTLCVAHGHLLRVLAARWVGLPPAAGRLWALWPGSVSVLGYEREVPVLTRWNEPPPP
jgi:probable phosphoglycerate mutase